MLRLASVIFVTFVLAGCVPGLDVPTFSPIKKVERSEPQTAYAKPRPVAELLIQDGRYADAASMLSKQVASNPRDLAAKTNLGLLYTINGQMDEGVELLEQITSKHPDACPAQVRLGQLHRKAFQFDAAEAAYKTCLQHDPEFAPALMNLGILYELYRGELSLALGMYERYQAVHETPDHNVAGWIADLSRRLSRAQQIAEARP